MKTPQDSELLAPLVDEIALQDVQRLQPYGSLTGRPQGRCRCLFGAQESSALRDLSDDFTPTKHVFSLQRSDPKVAAELPSTRWPFHVLSSNALLFCTSAC